MTEQDSKITFQTTDIQKEITEMQKYTNESKPTKTYAEFQAEQAAAQQPKVLTLGQNYLVASSGISKKRREKMTDFDIRKHEHLFKTVNNQMTPLQISYITDNFGFVPEGADWNYRSARKEIIKHLQATDFDERIKEYQDSWRPSLPQPASYDYAKTIDFEDDGE